MKYYFFGFLFLFLDFNISLPYGGVLNLLPAFMGYALLILATVRMGYENPHFRRLKCLAPVACVLSMGVFVFNLTAISLPKVAELIMSVVMTFASLYIAYEFAEGAKALERGLYKKLDADKISAAWIILSMASLLMFVSIYFENVFLPCLLIKLLAVAWFESATYHFERKLKTKKQ